MQLILWLGKKQSARVNYITVVENRASISISGCDPSRLHQLLT